MIELIVKQHRIGKNDRIIFIILKEHEKKFSVTRKLKSLFGKNIEVRAIKRVTAGAPCSILKGAKDLINNDTPLLIELADVIKDLSDFYKKLIKKNNNTDGIIPVAKTIIKSKPWGYVYMNKRHVKKLKEKQIKTTSNLATMGLYYFAKGKDFISAAEEMITDEKYMFDNNFFVGPVYNGLIKKGKKIIISKNKIINANICPPGNTSGLSGK